MKLIPNAGNDRVIDELRARLAGDSTLDIASSAFSLFAFAEIRGLLETLDRCRFVLPACDVGELKLLGSERDRPFRNRLMAREKMRRLDQPESRCAGSAWIAPSMRLDHWPFGA